MKPTVPQRVEAFIRRHGLISPGGRIVVLVSGGADSTCLWHVLGGLGYGVSALHVDHGLRGAESDADARLCRERFGADVVDGRGGASEAELRQIRYSFAAGRLRATGHTASDQVETVLLRLLSSGRAGGIKPRREDGVVRPLLDVWRDETRAYCTALGLPFREDTSNPQTKRGLLRDELLPLLRRLDPRAERNLLALADQPQRLPRKLEAALVELLATTAGTKHADLPGGIRARREYDRLTLEHGPVRWGPWTIEGDDPALEVRARSPGDRLARRPHRKLQDVFTDAKVPRAERGDWPVVVRDGAVVAVPGIVEDASVRAVRSPD